MSGEPEPAPPADDDPEGDPAPPAEDPVPPSEAVTRPPQEPTPASAKTRLPGRAPPGASTETLEPWLRGGTKALGSAPPEEPAERRGPVGRYLVDSTLGQGGMGVVYKAYDPQLRRHVALKLIRRSLSGRVEMFHRFLSEAQVTAQLQHPAIVPVYDMGRTRRRELYYTMRLVDGQTLAEVVHEALDTHDSERDLSLFRILQSFVLACRAMAYAHSRGVLHRDLKPDNIMIGRFGQVYLMDWGVAKILKDAAVEAHPEKIPGFPADEVVETSTDTATAVGVVLGTPAYMAPEQAAGSNDRLTPATDVYSLGAILYYVLTGRPPHDGTATDVLRRISKGIPPALPSSVREHVPADLERVVMDALEYDPARRLHSAEELASAIEAYLEGRSLQAASEDDAEFLRSYSSTGYRKPSLAVDLVLIRPAREGAPAAVYLARRSQPPYVGRWALPGGFVQLEESLGEAARRVVANHSSASEGLALEQLGTYDARHRDPRTRVVSIAFLARVGDEVELLDPPRGAWVEVESGPRLGAPAGPEDLFAFDHARIVQDALERTA